MKALYPTLLLFLLFTCCTNGKREANTPSTPTILFEKTIPEHPRLLFSKADEERIKKQSKSDPLLQKLIQLLKEEADKTLAAPLLPPPNDLSKSREHVYRVITLGMAYRLSGDEKYAVGVESILTHLCQYPDWHPEHYLDVAETTTAVAIGYDWLYHFLSDDTRDTIEKAIREKALNVAIPVYESTESSWARRETNWNVVCNTGMTMGALAIAESDPRLAEEVISHATRFAPNCLKHYAPDGVCYEGPSYWEFTNIYLSLLLKSLNDNLGHDFGLSSLPGVGKTALYYVQSLSPLSQAFNFANSGKGSSANPLFFYFGSTFNQPEVINYYRNVLTEIADGKRGLPRWNFFLSIAWYQPETGVEETPLPPLQVFKNDINPILVFNGDRSVEGSIYLSAKGGDPDEAHQHLDVGTFIIESDGVRWADDLGSDTYDLPGVWDYQPDGKRWNYFRNTNFSHNTLSIDNKIQYSGGKGVLDRYRTEGEEPYGIIDMTTAYQGQATSVLRGFKLLDDHTMLIQDEVTPLTGNQSITWSLITSTNIKLEGTTATLESEGKQFFIRVLSPADARLHVEEAKTFSEIENPLTGYQMLKVTVGSKSINESPLTVLVGSDKRNLERQAGKVYARISSWD